MAKRAIQATVLTGKASVGVAPGATITIKDAVTGANRTLWSDYEGTSGTGNPVTADANGQFLVYADPGRVQITVTDGVTTRIWENVELGHDDSPNKTINPEMAVAQRGTSFTGVGASAQEYTVDRFCLIAIGGPAVRATVTQEAGVFSGFKNSLKIDCTTFEGAVVASEGFALQYRAEGRDLQDLEYGTANAGRLVLTFTIKSPKTGIHCIALYQPDGARSYIVEYTVVAANTEETFTVIFDGDVAGTIDNDAGDGLRVTWPLHMGSTYHAAAGGWAAGEDYATANQQNLMDSVVNNFEITGIDLRRAEAAAPFLHRPYGVEFALCERYMEKSYNESVDPGTATLVGQVESNFAAAATFLKIPVQFSTPKRATPVVTIYSPFDGTAGQVDVGGSNIAGTVQTQGQKGFHVQKADGTHRGFGYHYTAISEL